MKMGKQFIIENEPQSDSEEDDEDNDDMDDSDDNDSSVEEQESEEHEVQLQGGDGERRMTIAAHQQVMEHTPGRVPYSKSCRNVPCSTTTTAAIAASTRCSYNQERRRQRNASLLLWSF